MNYKQDIEHLTQTNNLRILPTPVPNNMINLSSNDYLALNSDTTLWNNFTETYQISTQKLSSCSSRLLTGNSLEYNQLETTIEQLYGNNKKALVFGSGYHANTGILPAMTTKNDLIVADKLVHASIIDGLRLSNAHIERFKHNDTNHLRHILEKIRNQFQQCFIVTESIFSMDGDIAPLNDIVELKKQFNSLLYVDEAHAFGVRGKYGEGLCGEINILNYVDILVCTLGKAIASSGAFSLTSDIVKQYLVNHCRTLIFTTALPPINVAWSNFIIQQLPQMTQRRQTLKTIYTTFANQLSVFDPKNLPPTAGQSHIIPFIVGENDKVVQLSKILQNNGFYVLPIRYPTVPKATARLRFSLKADLNTNSLQQIVQIIKQNAALLD